MLNKNCTVKKLYSNKDSIKLYCLNMFLFNLAIPLRTTRESLSTTKVLLVPHSYHTRTTL